MAWLSRLPTTSDGKRCAAFRAKPFLTDLSSFLSVSAFLSHIKGFNDGEDLLFSCVGSTEDPQGSQLCAGDQPRPGPRVGPLGCHRAGGHLQPRQGLTPAGPGDLQHQAGGEDTREARQGKGQNNQQFIYLLIIPELIKFSSSKVFTFEQSFLKYRKLS